MNILWILAGVAFLLLAVIGLLLPVIPQVPFIIAAALCFMKGSPRIYRAMLRNPTVGPMIKNWQDDGTIDRKTKWFTTFSLAVAVGLSVVLGIPTVWLIVEVVIIVAVLAFVWSRPEPAPSKSQGAPVGK